MDMKIKISDARSRVVIAEPIGWHCETAELFKVEFNNEDFKLGRHGSTLYVTINVATGVAKVEYYDDRAEDDITIYEEDYHFSHLSMIAVAFGEMIRSGVGAGSLGTSPACLASTPC